MHNRSQARTPHAPGRAPGRRSALWLALGLSLVLGACSSTTSEAGGDGQGGTALRVTYQSYNTGQRLELVSEGHTGRLEQYSEVRSNANRKVQTDEVMAALVGILEKDGFYKHAQPGSFPADGAGRFAWAVEIENPKGTQHVLAHPGLSADEVKQLQRYMLAFIDTYNATYGLQAVDVAPGQEVFKTPTSR